MAAFFHIVVHAVMKTVLFLCAGAIYQQTGKKKVTELAGIGYKMPVTMGFPGGQFSMVGYPPPVVLSPNYIWVWEVLRPGNPSLSFSL